MDWVIVTLVFAFVIAFGALALTAIVSAWRTPDLAWRGSGRTRRCTVALIAFTGGLGGLHYWLRIRPDLVGLASSTDQATAPTKAEMRAIAAQRSLGG
jgi:hypothetical protein